jgi:CO/xanthine dehydrogenase FAD-binding subunit
VALNAAFYEGAAHPLVREYASGFAAAWGKIANVRVRFSATIGGNLMARHTRYECSILLSALEANARLRGPAGTFEMPVEKLWNATLPAERYAADRCRSSGTQQAAFRL